MKQPQVSIITPCYNGEAYLERYFQSILAQTYNNLELIFINDGSTDRTEEIALSYRGKLEQRGIHYLYEYQENAGQAAALNRGLKLFSGDYLTWPDSDDELAPDSIEQKVNFLLAHPEVKMVRSNGLYIDQKAGTRTRICSKPHEETEDILEPLLLVHTYGCCGCYMITRNLLLECYPDLDIYESRVGQNWQLLVPAASRSKCGYIDQDLYWVYVHEDSHSRKKRSYQQEYERWDAFTEVLLHAIEVSQCNQTACAQLVLENCARQKFYYAIAEKNKAVMRETFRVLQKNGSVTWKERMLYYKKQLL